MALKWSDKRQLDYGGQQGTNVWARFPSNARPIATAPVSATPIRVFDSTGKSQWALHHLGAWRSLAPYKDSFTGQTKWRMDGNMIGNAVAWASS